MLFLDVAWEQCGRINVRHERRRSMAKSFSWTVSLVDKSASMFDIRCTEAGGRVV